MKLSSTLSTLENKDKVIGLIKEFFDTKYISETARLTKFVQRESKLQGIFFFSVYLQLRMKAQQVWMIYVGNYKKMELKSENKVCRAGLMDRQQTSCERWWSMPYRRN
jgi:hypothetical protein